MALVQLNFMVCFRMHKTFSGAASFMLDKTEKNERCLEFAPTKILWPLL